MASEPTPETPPATPPARMSRLAVASAVLGALGFLWAAPSEVLEEFPGYDDPWPYMPLFAIAALLTSLWVFFRARGLETALTLARGNWLALVGLLLGLLGLAMSWRTCVSIVDQNSVSCRSNLKQIGLAIGMYQADNGGQMPQDLQFLVDTLCIKDTSVLQCPSAPKDKTESAGAPSYFCAGSLRPIATKIPPMLPIAWERKEWHRRLGVNVLYADLHVKAVPLEGLKRQVEEHQEWYASPPVLPE